MEYLITYNCNSKNIISLPSTFFYKSSSKHFYAAFSLVSSHLHNYVQYFAIENTSNFNSSIHEETKTPTTSLF